MKVMEHIRKHQNAFDGDIESVESGLSASYPSADKNIIETAYKIKRHISKLENFFAQQYVEGFEIPKSECWSDDSIVQKVRKLNALICVKIREYENNLDTSDDEDNSDDKGYVVISKLTYLTDSLDAFLSILKCKKRFIEKQRNTNAKNWELFWYFTLKEMEYSYLRLVHYKEGCLYLEKLADDSIECTERCKACGWNKERLIGLIESIIQELIRVFDVNRENIVNGEYEELLSDVFAHNIRKLAKKLETMEKLYSNSSYTLADERCFSIERLNHDRACQRVALKFQDEWNEKMDFLHKMFDMLRPDRIIPVHIRGVDRFFISASLLE